MIVSLRDSSIFDAVYEEIDIQHRQVLTTLRELTLAVLLRQKEKHKQAAAMSLALSHTLQRLISDAGIPHCTIKEVYYGEQAGTYRYELIIATAYSSLVIVPNSHILQPKGEPEAAYVLCTPRIPRNLGVVVGTRRLITSIPYYLTKVEGIGQCLSCKYSSEEARYCGRGLTTRTGGCTQWQCMKR